MAHESTYEPGTGIEIIARQASADCSLRMDTAINFPTPKNLNYWYTFWRHPCCLPVNPDRHRHHPGDALYAPC